MSRILPVAPARIASVYAISRRIEARQAGEHLALPAGLDQSYSRTPSVVVFFTPSAGNKAQKEVRFLEELAADIRVVGGKLWVISAIERKYWNHLLADQNSLFIYFDKDNRVAEANGLFDPANPSWKFISGLEEDAPVPVLYVLQPGGRIVYYFRDSHFALYQPELSKIELFQRELLTKVYENAAHKALNGIAV
jgi:peroxiredoxin